MILIFSVENDPSTTEIIRQLHQLGAPEVMRINSNDSRNEPVHLYMDQDSFTLDVNGLRIELSDLTSVWYRKGNYWFDNLFPQVAIPGHNALTRNLNAKGLKENLRIREYFHYLVKKNVRVLGSECRSELNKLITLDVARKVGFDVPPFFVSNHRETFEKRLTRGDQLITKPVSDGIYLWDLDEAQRGYFSFTEKLSVNMLESYDAVIPPSFAQERIDKDIELRVFFLDGGTYPMAIFSQNDEQTQIDYRKYNDDRPNRNVPYKLPIEIDERICALFQEIDLNTGSVDLMVDKNGRYYFLEINPTGQFGALSSSCNYHIEYKIAKWLMGSNNE